MATIGVSVLCSAVFGLVLYGLIRYFRLRQLINKIPGPRSYWFVGNMHQFKTDPTDWIEQSEGVCKVFNKMKMMRCWLSVFPFVMLYGADEAEQILTSTKHINKGIAYRTMEPWMGLGLLTSRSEMWRQRRKLLTPTFHLDILKDFVRVFNQEAKILINILRRKCDKGPFDIFPFITNCALDIICETAMSRKINAQGNEDSDYVKATYRINDLIHERQRKPWFWIDWAYWYFGDGKEFQWCLDVVHGFAQNVIDERWEEIRRRGGIKQIRLDNPKIKPGFLDLLLELVEQGKLPYEDVRQEVDTFMFGGHDTTSAAMSWTLFLVGNHPEIQKKIQHEVDNLILEDSSSEELGVEDLKKLEYLECCIKEAQRIYPSVVFLTRELAEDVNINGYEVPKSAEIMIWPYMVHRDPKHWPNPEVFDPDRFSPDNSAGRHPFAFIPFSAGPRNCIGQRFAFMEEKTILYWVFKNFSVRSIHRRDQVRLKPQIILRPAKGIIVELTPRDRANPPRSRPDIAAFA